MRQTFKKYERLYSKKEIDLLFNQGDSFFMYPFKVIIYYHLPGNNNLPKVLVSVSKRNFKKAVDRNRIKRLIREAYRKNKSILCDSLQTENKQLLIGLIYTGKTILPCPELERKIILILQRLNEQDEQTAG